MSLSPLSPVKLDAMGTIANQHLNLRKFKLTSSPPKTIAEEDEAEID
jgi:hypothetical protein